MYTMDKSGHAYTKIFSDPKPLQKHPKPLQKLSKNFLQKLQFFGPNFLSFFTILWPIMSPTWAPMFSKPPLLYLNLHYVL